MSNIMSVIFIVASLLLTFGYTRPAWSGMTGGSDLSKKSVAELKIERTQYEEALQKTREIEEVRNGLLAKYNSLSTDDLDRLSKLVPDGVDSVKLIVDLDNIARSYNLSMQNIKVIDAKELEDQKDTAQNDLYSFIGLTFEVNGPYDSLAQFVTDLERSLRVIDVYNLSILPPTVKPGEKESAVPTYKMIVSLKAYYLI